MPLTQYILMALPSLTIFLQLQLLRIRQALHDPVHASGPKRPDLTQQESKPVKTSKS